MLTAAFLAVAIAITIYGLYVADQEEQREQQEEADLWVH